MMSDRRPSKLYVYRRGDDFWPPVWDYEPATLDEALAFVRRGVESGTIEGKLRQEGPARCKHGEVTMHVYNYGETACAGPIAEKRWVLVILVSDGGEDRP